MLERSEQGEQTEIITLRTEENMRKISLILMVIHAAEFFPGGAHASVLPYLKPDWGKKSGADHTENSCLSSGIDGMNYTSFPCRNCITRSKN